MKFNAVLTLTVFLFVTVGCTSQPPASTGNPQWEAVIFAADEVPWQELENGWRRQVLFSGELTFVMLEAKGPTSGPIALHSHVNDQISYVVEGEIEVQIAEETRRISEGGFFRVPPGAPHGIQVLSPAVRLIDAFTPPREDFRKE